MQIKENITQWISTQKPIYDQGFERNSKYTKGEYEMQEIGKDFMKLTRFQYLGKAPQNAGYPQPPLQKEPDDAIEVIELPKPDTVHVKDMPVRRAIEHRTSVRSYSDKPLTLNELSYLLWCTQGVKETIEDVVTFRTVPSAGARHALETYLLINNVDGLEPGLYRFLAIGHRLLQLDIERHGKRDHRSVPWTGFCKEECSNVHLDGGGIQDEMEVWRKRIPLPAP